MLWSSLESLSLAGVSFVMLVMLARYIDASTFGRAALALGVVQIACSLVESFFHDAVVQRKALHDGDVDAAHTCGVIMALLLVAGIALYAVLAVSPAPLVRGPEVATMALWMAPSILATSFCSMSIAQMRRRLAMRELALATAGSRLLAGGVGIAMLAQGYGIWGLVVQQNLAALMLLILLRVVHAPGARLTGDLSGARRLAGYAVLNSLSGLINANLSRAFQLLCGVVLPASVVGQVSLALRMVEMLVSVMVTGVARVAMPRLAAALHAGEGVAPGFLVTTRRVCLVMLPVLVLISVLAQPLVRFVGGEGWDQAAVLVAWFAMAQALRSPSFLANALFSSLGKPQVNLLVSVVDFTMLVLFTWTMHSPLAWIARLAVVLPLVLWLVHRHAGIPPWALLKSVHQPFIAALAMGVLMAWVLPAIGLQKLPPVAILAAAGLAGGLIYATFASLLLGRGRLGRW